MGSKAKGVILSIALIVIALLLLPITIDSTHDVITDTQADTFAACVVAAGATDVVLTEDLYLDDTTFVVTITSSDGLAVPAAGTYTALTNTLNVTGLGANTPQDIGVTYDYEVNADYNGVNAITGLIPLLVIVGLIIVAVINGLWAIKKGD